MPPSVHAYISRIANIAIGPSTLRNQGAPGVTTVAREFLASLDPSRFAQPSETGFLAELNAQTEALVRRLPPGAQNWGTARKALNVFLGECYYHHFVRQHFALEGLVHLLEVPLDSQVAGFLYKQARSSKDTTLPPWPGI